MKWNKETTTGLIIVIVSIFVALFISYSPPGRLLDLKLYDIFSMIKPRPAEWNKILYVDIDDQTIDLLGNYPPPRYRIANGISVLKKFGADKILLDIEYIDPAPIVLNQENFKQLIDSQNAAVPMQYIQDDLVIQPDRELAKAFGISPINVYLPCRGVDQSAKERTDISKDQNQELQIVEKFFIPLKDKKLTNTIPSDKLMESPAFPIYLSAKSLGFTTSIKDIDGSLRKIGLFSIYKDYLVPQLSMPIIFDEFDIDRDKIEIKPGNYVKLVSRDGKTTFKIPILENGEMYINWTKKWAQNPFGRHLPFSFLVEYYDDNKVYEQYQSYLTNKNVSEEDKKAIREQIKVLEPILSELSNKISVVNGKITITGWTAEASTDRGMITIDPVAPLVLLQGTLINTIYQKAFLTKVPDYMDISLIILLGFMIFIVSLRLTSALREIVFSGLIIAFILILDYVLLALFGQILNYILILLHAFISLIAFIIYKFMLYDRQKNYIKKAFMQYLSPDVVKQVIDNPSLLKLGGERREITAYFSDVAGFTSISEKLSPEDLVGLLNKYLTAMTDIILANGGTVDKYEGDAIVAFFGAPIPHPDHAIRCCNAAVDMQATLQRLRSDWEKEGLPSLNARMGINTGQAVIGNMGSQQRMDYTMMGDTVNSASRFEGANKAYGTYTMISDSTYEYVKDKFIVRKLDLLRVVGKTKPVAVYELVGRTGEVEENLLKTIKLYEEALQEYNNRNWQTAINMFQDIIKNSNDAPSQTYLGRCTNFKKNPPPDDWDGVFVLKTK